MSLRTLMLLVLVAGGGLGWFASRNRREAHRQWVIATIRASLSSIDLDGEGISRIVWFGGSANPASLPRRPPTAEQLEALGSCDRLRELTVLTGVVADDGLARIARAGLLERLYLFEPEITDAGVKHLAGLENLKKLEFHRVPGLTDASLAYIAGVAGLEGVTLLGTSIDGSGLVHLARMEKLATLSLPESALDDRGLANLGRLTRLRELYISGGHYTDAGLASLAGLRDLSALGLGPAGCTDAGLASLAGLTKLETLSVEGSQVTDAWLDRMAAPRSLRDVQVSGAQVSDEAIARLHRSLPGVRIHVDGKPR